MKMKTLGWLVGAGALASSFLSCSQAKVECTAAHAGAFYAYAAVYKAAAPPACAPADSLMPGDEVGFETYHPSVNNGDGEVPDYNSTLIAIQASSFGAEAKARRADGGGDPLDPLTPGIDPKTVKYTGGHNAYAFGNFDATEPDANDFCAATTLTAALQEFPEVPPEDPMMDPTPLWPKSTVKYDWKNVQVYVTATSQGTQFSADLTHTVDDCSVDYKVIGVWPGVHCIVGEDEMTGEPIFDDAQCCPDPNPNGGRPYGSGINPDFPVVCDRTLGLCVLDTKDGDKLPVVKTDWSKSKKECELTPAPSGAGGGGS